MACIGCHYELSPGFAFCPRCGSRQPLRCSACGFSCEEDFAFCPRCGVSRGVASSVAVAPVAALNALRREADRRQVTVLFADLCGFTTLSERLDPEEVRAFQNALFETLAEVIARFDGFVAKFMGDAVLAIFGAPVAHEDDAERALDAALDMLARGARLSERWAARLGQPVTLHIAVHTGRVVAGNLPEAVGAAYDVTGDTVNTASRLLALAGPGTVLASAATYAATRHRFGFEPAGEGTLRGKSETVAVYRLTGVLAVPGSSRGLVTLGLNSLHVGRAGELEQLLTAVQRMQRGRAQLVSLVGEAGTGKSRLIAELLARLEADGQLGGIAVRRVACSSLGEPTYGVFATIFREGYGVDPADSLEVARNKLTTGLGALGASEKEAEAIAPMLSYVLGTGETAPRDVEPEQVQRQIVLAVRTLLERRLQKQPVLIVVDDVHWADAASIDLLRGIVDQLPNRPLMLLLSHRPDVRPPQVARAEESVIRLAPLSSDQTRALVAGLLGPSLDDAGGQLQDFVAARSGGNPLFVEEILRSLIGKGVLVRQGNGWTCRAAFEAADVPPTLQSLLLSRVDRLSAEARRLLQEAAVIGSEFDETLLRAITTVHETGLLDHLVEADLVQPLSGSREDGSYRFTHGLVHEVVYQNLLLASRTELHGRVARALEPAIGQYPERLSDLEALGHHWSLSADKPKGARYLLMAGDWARAVYANEDAIQHYESVLRTLGDNQYSGELQAARERLADLLGLTGRRAEGLAHYETVLAEFKQARDRASVARLHRKIGGLHWDAGDRERAAAAFAAGLEQLGDGGASIERAHLFQEMGRLAFRAGDNAAAVSWSERALAEVDERDHALDPERKREAAAMRAQVYNTLGIAFARTGRLVEAVAQIERSIELAEANELLQAACRGYANLGVLYSSLQPSRSIETCLRGLETAKKVGDLGFQSRLYANLAVSYCALTDRCEAQGVEAAQIAIDLDRKLGLLDHLAVPLIVLGQIHQCSGDHGAAFASFEEALRLAEHAGEPQLLFPCYDGLATLHLDAGNQDLAERYLAKSQELCERAGLEPEGLMVLPFLS
jgi:adenylate cyclase